MFLGCACEQSRCPVNVSEDKTMVFVIVGIIIVGIICLIMVM